MRASSVSRRVLSPGLGALLLALLVAGCEPDDPAIRQELAQMRTDLADAQRELATLRTSLTAAEQKAAQVDFLDATDLAASLKGRGNELRTVVIQACPGTRIESFSIGAVETPVNTPAPYRAKFNFSLRQLDPKSGQPVGENLGPYTVSIQADREGSWQLPSARDLAARLGGMTVRSPQRGTEPPTANTGRTLDEGSRQIDWGNGPASQSGQPQRPSAPDSGAAQPAAPANPMPSQETREIRFE